MSLLHQERLVAQIATPVERRRHGVTETKDKVRGKYRTTNWKTYNAALKARGSLTMRLDQGMQCWQRRMASAGRGAPDLLGCGYPVLLDYQIPVRVAAQTSHGHAGKPVVLGEAGLANARLQHGFSAPGKPADGAELPSE